MKINIGPLKLHLKKPSVRTYIFIAAGLALLVLGCLFYWQSFKAHWPQYGILAEDQLFPASPEFAYRNLDLKIAGQASYQGGQIQKVRDLGIIDGVRETVISFTVHADNLTEYGLMTQPLTPKPVDGYPAIILCHGYVTPKKYSTYLNYTADMREYSRAGFIVIKPDFRGQGLSLNSGTPEGAYYSMGYNTDVMSLISSIKQASYIDKSNINLWGHSMGAYIALRAAVISPDIKNLVLLSGPVGNIQDSYKTYVPISDRNNPTAIHIKEAVILRYGTPLTNPKFWKTTSPLSYLQQLRAFVQIHVGTADKIVPPKFSAELNRALESVHKPHAYYVYQGASHGLLGQRPLIYQRSLKLLRPSSAN